MTEAALARKFVNYMKNKGHDVYEEVLCPEQTRVADIYAVNSQTTTALEVKTQFGLAVLEQAYYWRLYATYTYVCVPALKSRRSTTFAMKVASALGIGILVLDTNGRVKELLRPKKNNPIKIPRLVKAQKKSAAGSNDRSHWTPLKGTITKLYHYTKTNGGIVKLTDAIAAVDHHYKHNASAQSSLMKHIPKTKGMSIIIQRGIPFIKIME